jgi:hypothetical protein
VLVGDDGFEIGLGGVAPLDGAHETVEAGEAFQLFGAAEFRGIQRAAQHGGGFIVGFEGHGKGVAILASRRKREARRMLPKVWPAIESLQANTAEMPVYWEQFEPEPGRFDYSTLDTLLSQAREHHVRLVLLWFGTWKNASSHYMPLWMKRDPERYPRMTGANGRLVDSPSPHAPATLAADKHAFAALMRHLKAADPRRTVIMVQGENEAGTWGSVRDHSPGAQKAFEGPVPAEPLAALDKHPGSPTAPWSEVFGADADEFFHVWNGDQTDWGLNFTAAPQVLRVTLGTY